MGAISHSAGAPHRRSKNGSPASSTAAASETATISMRFVRELIAARLAVRRTGTATGPSGSALAAPRDSIFPPSIRHWQRTYQCLMTAGRMKLPNASKEESRLTAALLACTPTATQRSDWLVGRRLFPQVDAALRRVAIDLGQFLFREFEILQRTDVLAHLLRLARTDQGRRHAATPQRPCERHLRKALAAPLRNVVQLAHVLDVLRAQMLSLQRSAARLVDARIVRHAVQILAGEKSLRERREGDAARAEFIERIEQFVLHPAVQHVVRRLMDQERHLVFTQQLRHLARLCRRVRRNADVQRLTLLHGGSERAGGFFERRVGIEAMRVEDVDVIEPHALQALIETRKHILARAAALAVGTGPHVPAGLR